MADSCIHNSEFECFSCAENRHRNDHPEFVEGCRTCKLQTITIHPNATPNKSKSPAPPAAPRNHWEKGVALDHRGLPYRDAAGNAIPVKKFAENRSKYEAEIRRQRTAPDPLGASTKG